MGESPERLTAAQRRILDILQEFADERGMAPTLQEVADIAGIKPPSVRGFLRVLERKGYIRRIPHKARAIEILRSPGDAIKALVTLPVVGEVPAGKPLWAEENIVGEISVERSLVRNARCFALRVDGESMVDAGIQPDDLVIIRQQPLAEHGEIIVAVLNGEATLKRLGFSEGNITLIPENPVFEPIRITPDDELRIVGKVIAVRRPETLPS